MSNESNGVGLDDAVPNLSTMAKIQLCVKLGKTVFGYRYLTPRHMMQSVCVSYCPVLMSDDDE